MSMLKRIGRLSALLKHEAAGGVLLMLAAAAALALDNSPLAHLYDALLTIPVVVQIGALALEKPLLLWINDGLMALFFLLVGLEIKRELLEGNLSSWRQAVLPALAALGGMVRRLVGAMVQVGRGRLSLTEFEAILRSRDIERAKVLAPPQGLVLEAVGYAPDDLPNPTCVSAATATDAPLEERI